MSETPQAQRRQIDKNPMQHQIEEEKRLLEIEAKLKSLDEKMDIVSADVADLVTAWKAASWLVNVIKWIGGIAVAVTAIISFFKGFKS